MAKTTKKISKAPPPINPLRLTSPVLSKFNTTVDGTVDWAFWGKVKTVEVWQGLLLSLNIKPTGGGWLIDNAPGIGDIPYEYLKTEGLEDEFVKRWYLFKNLLEALYLKAGASPLAELTDFISLWSFAKYCSDFEFEVPSELASLAVIQDIQTPRQRQQDFSNKQWWQQEFEVLEMAQAEASRLARALGKAPSQRIVAGKVAHTLYERERAKATEEGRKARPTPNFNTLRNTALKGWKYKPD